MFWASQRIKGAYKILWFYVLVRETELFAREIGSYKVVRMPDFDFCSSFEGLSRFNEPVGEEPTGEDDFVMEQILDNMNSTPIGQVLKKIASLPEGRRNKVLDVRQQLTEGKYDLNERLDMALEKVLEELGA